MTSYTSAHAVRSEGSMTAAERFWYALMNVALATGYFLKLPIRKAIADRSQAELTGAETFWYYLSCVVTLGGAYMMKVVASRALEQSGQ